MEKRLKCPYCGYEWNYNGNMIWATCPRCLYKIKVENNEVTGDSQ